MKTVFRAKSSPAFAKSTIIGPAAMNRPPTKEGARSGRGAVPNRLRLSDPRWPAVDLGCKYTHLDISWEKDGGIHEVQVSVLGGEQQERLAGAP